VAEGENAGPMVTHECAECGSVHLPREAFYADPQSGEDDRG